MLLQVEIELCSIIHEHKQNSDFGQFGPLDNSQSWHNDNRHYNEIILTIS